MQYSLSCLFFIFAVLTTSYSQKSIQGFEIRGSVHGFADSTLIFLDDDSTFIINNQFHFTGSLRENVKHSLIRTANFSDYKYLWLENSEITFKAEKGKFRDAIVNGSKTQDEQSELDASVKATGKEKDQDILFIGKHPNSIVSAYVLDTYACIWGKDTAKLLYDKLSAKIKNTSYGKNILEFLTLNKDVKVGSRYVDFTEPNIQGANVSLSDFTGKIVLLEFWASWCVPCRQGNPELVKIYDEYKNKGFDILAVSADIEKESWIEAVQKDNLIWQNVCDLKGDRNKAALIYGISYFPANFLIDKNGIIIARDLRGDALRNKLNEVLK